MWWSAQSSKQSCFSAHYAVTIPQKQWQAKDNSCHCLHRSHLTVPLPNTRGKWADLTTKGTLIGSNDLLVAAIALANGLTLVTHNTREFARVVGLKIEDWES
jgi:hypothetical protein